MKNILYRKFVFVPVFLCASWLLPVTLKAQIIITEIMYNPESSDSGREWVEIYNYSDTDIDLSDYKLLENGTNHKLSAHNEGEIIIEPQEYAVVADNSTIFLEDYSQNGLLIDSAFSLRNDGEEISIVNPMGVLINTVNYFPDWGANGTGNSLQNTNFDSNQSPSNWIPADPTPFSVNKTEAEDENSGQSDDNNDSGSGSNSSNSGNSASTHSGINELSEYNPKTKLKISAGRDRYVAINTPIEFELIHNQDSNKGISAVWSMGDGKRINGKNIDYI